MNYGELAVMQASRAKTFSAAQTDAMAAYCQAEHDLKELQAENAKLRELCGELYHELYAARDEHWPASYLGDLEPRDVFPRYDELIELGVDA